MMIDLLGNIRELEKQSSILNQGNERKFHLPRMLSDEKRFQLHGAVYLSIKK